MRLVVDVGDADQSTCRALHLRVRSDQGGAGELRMGLCAPAARWTRRHQFGADQLRKGLGRAVFAAGCYVLSVLDRGAPGAVQVIPS